MSRYPQPHTEEVPSARVLMWATALAFVVVEGSIRIFDLYRRAPWMDLPSHFLSGAAVTTAILLYLGRRGLAGGPWRAMVGNAAVALAWEAAETLDEVFTPDPPYLQDVFFWDGFWDVVSALAGGLALLWAVRRSGPQGRKTALGSPDRPTAPPDAGGWNAPGGG